MANHKYPTKGPGDLPEPTDDPRSPAYDPPPTMLECSNETGTWLYENMEEPISTAANEILSDYLAGPRDKHAEQKVLREMLELAGKCEAAIERFEASERAGPD